MRIATVTVTVTAMEHEIHDDDSALHNAVSRNEYIYVSLVAHFPKLTN
jgi:hypothetical protein